MALALELSGKQDDMRATGAFIVFYRSHPRVNGNDWTLSHEHLRIT